MIKPIRAGGSKNAVTVGLLKTERFNLIMHIAKGKTERAAWLAMIKILKDLIKQIEARIKDCDGR